MIKYEDIWRNLTIYHTQDAFGTFWLEARKHLTEPDENLSELFVTLEELKELFENDRQDSRER